MAENFIVCMIDTGDPGLIEMFGSCDNAELIGMVAVWFENVSYVDEFIERFEMVYYSLN